MKYLVYNNNEKQVYYHNQKRGICCAMLDAGTRENVVLEDGTNNFFVYRSNDNTIHLIAEDIGKNLVYMECKNNQWKKYVLGSVKKEIKIKRMMIAKNRIGQSLFYSALYNGEYILVHCVLGNSAMPQTIAKLADENFFIHKSSVYYTNSNEILGYQLFADGKPEKFVPFGKGLMPYVKNIDDKTYIVYKKEDSIWVNNNLILEDPSCMMPILANTQKGPAVVWRSAEKIKQAPLSTEKQTNVKSSVFGLVPEMFLMSDGVQFNYYYGVISNGELKVFYSDDPFSERKNYNNEKELKNYKEETQKLKSIIEQLKEELTIYKNELIKLNEALKENTNLD